MKVKNPIVIVVYFSCLHNSGMKTPVSKQITVCSTKKRSIQLSYIDIMYFISCMLPERRSQILETNQEIEDVTKGLETAKKVTNTSSISFHSIIPELYCFFFFNCFLLMSNADLF